MIIEPKNPRICGDGFTLLEVMIALAIIGTALTAILHTVNYHADVMYKNTVTTHIVQSAKEKMHELEILPQNSQGTLSPSGYLYETQVLSEEDSSAVKLRTIIKGHGQQIVLDKLVYQKEPDF